MRPFPRQNPDTCRSVVGFLPRLSPINRNDTKQRRQRCQWNALYGGQRLSMAQTYVSETYMERMQIRRVACPTLRRFVLRATVA